jgi:DNA invertase Pin-like site-specific DNA recombinase
MIGAEKLEIDHRQRRAFVYVRQSTMAQVRQHRTSTERQCDLQALAVQLGWSSTQVELVVADLGRSAKFSENREGFKQLVVEVGLGHIGAVFSLDAARLARSSADWHRLLELAGLTRTLLIDEHTIYDPRDPNDRLLLGMKGTMADFELVWLRQRMLAGRWHLARRGECRLRPPAGYVYDGDQLVQDPDEEIRHSVELLFERYRQAGSCRDIVAYFAEHDIKFPARFGSRVVWNRLTYARAQFVLHNPLYAGSYVYARRRYDTVLEDGQRRKRVRRLPVSEWPVVLHDAHAGYLTWEEFLANQKRLEECSPRRSTSGEGRAPRDGAALLQGLLICGKCTTRLNVAYSGTGGRYPTYFCSAVHLNALGTKCISVGSRNIEGPVVELVLQTLTRGNLDAAMKVVELIEQEDAALEQQWKLRLERARYEARRAERQYDLCDPENRVVARTLEARWNEKLEELHKLEVEHEEVKRRQRIELTDVDRRRIFDLAANLPKLWRARATADRDRKMLLRLLIRDISVRSIDVPRAALRLAVLWHTGAVTEIEVDRVPHKLPPRQPRPQVSWRLVGTSAPRLTACS